MGDSRSAEAEQTGFDSYHCFGSSWFCAQMQAALSEQLELIRDMILNCRDERFHKIAQLLCGLESTASSIIALFPDRRLNEAIVLTRLLIERTLTVCYLFATADESLPQVKGGVAGQNRPTPLSGAEALIKASAEFRFSETYDSTFLEKS
jgi:hypothetical protein